MSLAPTPALVILAAGGSRRLGRCKALVDLGGRTALRRLLDSGRECTDSPLVVTGAHDAEIRAALAAEESGEELEILFNPHWEQGRTGGLALAVAARPGRDLVMAPVDHPLAPPEVFASLAREWGAAGSPGRGWLAPRYTGTERPGEQGRCGHPLLLGRDLAREVAAMGPDQPLRELRERARPAWTLDTHALGVRLDLDTPLDLRELRSQCD